MSSVHSHEEKQLFVLDTNVLMHDPSSLFRFQEHDVFLPMPVLEELDNNKRGHSEVARNARQASRFLEDIIGGSSKEDIENGLKIVGLKGQEFESGKLYFQTHELAAKIPGSLPGNKPDNNILSTAIALQNESKDRRVVLVTKDINLRIKAAALGIPAEDYYNDQVIDDVNLLYSGSLKLEDNFWDTFGDDVESWQDEDVSFFRLKGDTFKDWYPNQYIYNDAQDFHAIVKSIQDKTVTIQALHDYRNPKHSVWGINARNREQNFALNVLLDPEIDFVTLLGAAGTGKTLLTLAAGLAQTLDMRRYHEIIVTRVTVPVGEDIGYLPGSEEEKMTPWMGALMDNLDVLTHSEDNGEWEKAATHDLLAKRIKIRSLNFMRGRTFLNRYLIIDEAQNLTSKQMKTLITRAGPGTKVVCLGNV
ncbi:MAG: PhoH family protein, partial [Gammaproteobacteria bacterium]|nr:PhoH family protein [Gammaproteobacteria bacterium]